MGKEALAFSDIEVEKNKFLYGDIEKVLVSNKISLGEKKHKYFISHLYNDNKVWPLHITPPKTSAYVKSYDETK